MKLIRAHDGLIGLNIGGKIIWCDTMQEAIRITYGHFGHFEHITMEAIAKDIQYAMDHMAKTGDTIAEFGIFGSFMYTTTEPEYEF